MARFGAPPGSPGGSSLRGGRYSWSAGRPMSPETSGSVGMDRRSSFGTQVDPSPPVSPTGRQNRICLTPKVPPQHSLLSSSAKSRSSPSLKFGQYPPKIWTEEEKQWRRVALSPQGLFSRTLPPDGPSASMTGNRFHESGANQLLMDIMTGKDKPSSRRTATAPILDAAAVAAAQTDAQRTSTAPQQPGELTRTGSLPALRPSTGPPAPLGSPTPPGSPSNRATSLKDIKDKRNMFDLREGLRVMILGATPAPLGSQKVWPPPKSDRRPPNKAEAMEVYAAFNDVLAIDGADALPPAADSADASGGDGDGEGGAECAGDASPISDSAASLGGGGEGSGGEGEARPRSPTVRGTTKPGLQPLKWRSFFTWVETASCAVDVRKKCLYEALLKSAKVWYSQKATSEQRRNGLPLSTIFKWIWPFMGPKGLRQVFEWICLEEYEKVRLPEPPPIDDSEAADIKRLYETMDLDGKGYCVPLDIAGGDHAEIIVRLRNTIDEASVKRILGDRVIPFEEFLELMCEDGYRGYEGSTRAVMRDGRYIVHFKSQVLDFEAWVFKDAPKEQTELLRLASALEQEVVYWAHLAETTSRTMGRTPTLGELTVVSHLATT